MYSGGIIYQRKNENHLIGSIYKNKMLERWSKFTEKPENYQIDEEEYQEIISKFLTHNCMEYVKSFY